MYYLLKLIGHFFGALSYKANQRVAHAITFLIWSVFRFRRSLITKNIRIAFGDTKSQKEVDYIGKTSIFNFIMTALEFFRSLDHKISERVQFSESHFLTDQLKPDCGAYILCWHMGNWEAMASAITKTFRPSKLIVKKVGSDSVDRFVTEVRENNGFNPIVSTKKKGEAFKAIKQTIDDGNILGFPMDQARPGSPRLEFFGKPAKTNASFAAICLKKKAPIVPGYVIRDDEGRHVVTFMEAHKLIDTGNFDQDVLDNSLEFNKIIEGVVKKHPEHYFWLHNRWK